MNNPVQSCTKCGAGLTPQDLMGVSCRFCGQALPHQVAAAQQAQLVNNMLANPQTMQNMANLGAQYQQNYQQQQYGQPGMPPQGPYGAPPPGAYGPYGGQPGAYYGAPQVQAAMAGAQRTVMISVVLSLVVGLVIMGVVFAMVMR
ncbi:MAG: hypothetical protein ABI175_11950 [Polyangiales bacterium]